jgi:DNA-binding MarR family transcriptional regulator
MAGSKFDLSDSPGHLLRRAQQYAFDLFSAEIGDSKLTPRQFAVLLTVQQNEGLSQTDLVRRTGIDRSTLADMISRLIKRGTLSRTRTKEDARANSVKITAAGRKEIAAHSAKVKKAEAKILGPIAKSQHKNFMTALKAIAAAADALEAADAKPAKAAPKKKAAAKKKKAAPKKKAAKRKAAPKKAAKKKAAPKKAAKKRAAPKKAAKKPAKKKAAKKKAARKKK